VISSHAQIWIKTLTGRKQQFNFEPDDQVLQVKQALQEKEGIQVCSLSISSTAALSKASVACSAAGNRTRGRQSLS
jgi:Ubiquitin family